MKFSLSLALLTAFFIAACSEEPPPQPTRQRVANYPGAGAEEYPPPQQPFNPNGPVQRQDLSRPIILRAPVAAGKIDPRILRDFASAEQCWTTTSYIRC